jgi:hypothetical protein
MNLSFSLTVHVLQDELRICREDNHYVAATSLEQLDCDALVRLIREGVYNATTRACHICRPPEGDTE